MFSQDAHISVSVPSTPPLSSPSPPPSSSRTNSLVVTGLPPAFFHPIVLQALRDHFAAYGEIYAWAPVRAFARVILVYYSEDDAESAKIGSDGLTIDETSESPRTTLRVYRADPTPLTTSTPSGSSSPTSSRPNFSPYHLRPPAIEKNFLISPPGSPPVGWVAVREEPPNNTPLADDLIVALRRLQFSQACEDGEGRRTELGLSVLIEPEEGPGVGVYVEDCGDIDDDNDSVSSDEGEGWFYGVPRPNSKFVPMPTMRPPMQTTA